MYFLDIKILTGLISIWYKFYFFNSINVNIISFKLLINLKNVIPNENISHFSGLNIPIYYYPINYFINSGAI